MEGERLGWRHVGLSNVKEFLMIFLRKLPSFPGFWVFLSWTDAFSSTKMIFFGWYWFFSWLLSIPEEKKIPLAHIIKFSLYIVVFNLLIYLRSLCLNSWKILAVVFYFCIVFVWVWHQDNTGLIKWAGKCVFFHFLEESVQSWC